MNSIPSYIYPFLWSYEVDKLDVLRDKKRIITNVLNLGTSKATKWLFGVYDKKEIAKVVSEPLPGEWNKKSLNFWSIVFGVKPKNVSRKIA